MAKILISNSERTKWLTGSLSRQEYSFTDNKNLAFCFDNEREAIEFEEAGAVNEFLELEQTDLVTYEDPHRSIYSSK